MKNGRAHVARRAMARFRRAIAGNPLTRSLELRRHRRLLTRAFITSAAYPELMTRHFDSRVDGNDSAERMTENFRYRHFKRHRTLGAWRWLGALEYREVIAEAVFDESRRGLDLGGARGPISPLVVICDRLAKDVFGREVPFRGIDEIDDESLDYIWTSHTLEHIPELPRFLGELSAKLRPGGRLFAMVPAWTCTRWRAGVHDYADTGGASPHLYTFALAGDKEAGDAGLSRLIRFDTLVSEQLFVEEAAMTGDNSIFLMARRS